MDVESRRDLQLLEALEQEATITQRTLASRLGMALGLTNLYLKRLIRKGYVKCVTVSPNRLVYSLTPRGVARKARLTYEFMKYSLDFYRDARQHLRRSLSVAVAKQKSVAIYGTGDAAELVFLLVRDMGLELTAVFAPEGNGRFLGLPVLPITDQAHCDLRRADCGRARAAGGHSTSAAAVGCARREDPDAPAAGRGAPSLDAHSRGVVTPHHDFTCIDDTPRHRGTEVFFSASVPRCSARVCMRRQRK